MDKASANDILRSIAEISRYTERSSRIPYHIFIRDLCLIRNQISILEEQGFPWQADRGRIWLGRYLRARSGSEKLDFHPHMEVKSRGRSPLRARARSSPRGGEGRPH